MEPKDLNMEEQEAIAQEEKESNVIQFPEVKPDEVDKEMIANAEAETDTSTKPLDQVKEEIKSSEVPTADVNAPQVAIEDPENPINTQEQYTHEDGLHPYDGYEVMANAIDLSLFE